MEKHTQINKWDRLIAVGLMILVLLVGMLNLKIGMSDWGDDNTAYISEGIAIANNTLEEQTKLNVRMHPSPLPDEAKVGKLVYVWGYPLMLSYIYKMVGFDTENYSTVIYYKLPALICFAISAYFFYLFFRRRFPRGVSLTISLLAYSLSLMYKTVNKAYSDLPFLMTCMMIYYFGECLCDWNLSKVRSVFISLCYAAAVWACYVIRLNGITVIAVMGCWHILIIITHRHTLTPFRLSILLTPYILMFAGMVVAYQFLPAATSNMSDLKNPLKSIIDNLSYYIEDSIHPWYLLIAIKIPGIAILLLGLITSCKKEIYAVVLSIGTLIVTFCLPYRQGFRYYLNIMAFLLMFVVYGVSFIYTRLQDRKCIRSILGHRRMIRVLTVCLVIAAWCPALLSGVSNAGSIITKQPLKADDMYSRESIEVYHYIRDNTSEDTIIACRKPRALYLNTNRVSFVPGVNEHEITEADYYLIENTINGREINAVEILEENNIHSFRLIFENKQYKLFSAS